MDIFIGILTVVEVLVCLLMILVVLMQRPRQEGLGASFGDGTMSQLVGTQTTSVLQRFTVYLAIALFILTLSLAVLTSKKQVKEKAKQIFDAPPPLRKSKSLPLQPLAQSPPPHPRLPSPSLRRQKSS